jgi:quercetin dioxygenase-like cupin family protein
MMEYHMNETVPFIPRSFSDNQPECETKKRVVTVIFALSLLALSTVYTVRVLAADANTKSQTIARAGSQPSAKGPAEYFTGNVRVDPLFAADESINASGAYVTFEPGARSAWHVHPAGQRLIVTAGVGRTGTVDGTIVEIKAGDVVTCPPGVKHWHGASPTTAMTHIAITGTVGGKNVEWMEKVTDEEYQTGTSR